MPHLQPPAVSWDGTTVDATPTDLFLDESGVERFDLPDHSTHAFEILVVARDVATDASASWRAEGAVKRGVGAASVAFVGSVSVTLIGRDLPAFALARFDVVADILTGALTLRVTGAVGTTIDWQAIGRLVRSV